MKRIDFAWPEGVPGAFTSSWDDGTIHDRRLIKMLNKYGLKGTFNLNSGRFGAENAGWNSCIVADEVKKLYTGHEVAVHTVTHPWLERQAEDMVLSEVLEDRKNLEKLVGYPVRGMALPMGSYDNRVLAVLRHAGILYVRPTSNNPDKFTLPGDFMVWQSTAHQAADLTALWNEFLTPDRYGNPRLFYLWGHSYEFERDHSWKRIDAFLKKVGKTPKIWFATNMEIYEYVTAWRQLQCSVDVSSIKNCSAVTVWYRYDGKFATIKPGEIVTLA